MKFATELVSSGTEWLDAAALQEGLLRSAGGQHNVSDRLAAEFRRFSNTVGFSMSDADWNEAREQAVQEVRIAVMLKMKGGEPAKRLEVEFDPQVRTAASLLRLAAPSPPSL